ncbi:MAG: prephenate dehydrogenase [Planctomycetaceae bacterium]|nr:prephenate dehydrogenase [Planctomycetaceae bacterium]
MNSVAIVGVGLIGGSIGLAARRAGIKRIVGIGRNRDRLEEALRLDAITDILCLSDNLSAGLAEVELIVVCTPVGLIVDQIRELAAHARPGTLFTDGGSTKRSIAEALDGPLANDCRFVGSHPLAGSEKTGVDHARAELFEGRVAMIAPTKNSREEDVQRLAGFWEALGARVVQIAPDEHDRAMAATSHMPHAVAVALAASLSDEFKDLTGTGFGDTSRLAAGDPDMWQQIFLDNRQHVGNSIRNFVEELQRLAELIEDADATKLEKYLTRAKKKRDALGS